MIISPLLRLDYGRSQHAYVNQRLQIQLELLMMCRHTQVKPHFIKTVKIVTL